MIGIDANVLVALAAEQHPHHALAVAAFERELSADEEIILTEAIAAEFLHVITDPKRITPAHEIATAIAWLREWTIEVAPTWLTPTAASRELWWKWMEEFKLGRKRILDTQYAALLHTNGVRRLLTNNGADFSVFNVFEIMTW